MPQGHIHGFGDGQPAGRSGLQGYIPDVVVVDTLATHTQAQRTVVDGHVQEVRVEHFGPHRRTSDRAVQGIDADGQDAFRDCGIEERHDPGQEVDVTLVALEPRQDH